MAKTGGRKNLRGAYEQARRVDPKPITGKEKPQDILETAFGAYVGRQERTAFELMKRLGVSLAVRHIPDTREPLETTPDWYVLIELASGEPGAAFPVNRAS